MRVLNRWRRVAIGSIALGGEIVSLKEFLPGYVNRIGISLVALVELVNIANVCIRYI
jgi:hypothetical protein